MVGSEERYWSQQRVILASLARPTLPASVTRNGEQAPEEDRAAATRRHFPTNSHGPTRRLGGSQSETGRLLKRGSIMCRSRVAFGVSRAVASATLF